MSGRRARSALGAMRLAQVTGLVVLQLAAAWARSVRADDAPPPALTLLRGKELSDLLLPLLEAKLDPEHVPSGLHNPLVELLPVSSKHRAHGHKTPLAIIVASDLLDAGRRLGSNESDDDFFHGSSFSLTSSHERIVPGKVRNVENQFVVNIKSSDIEKNAHKEEKLSEKLENGQNYNSHDSQEELGDVSGYASDSQSDSASEDGLSENHKYVWSPEVFEKNSDFVSEVSSESDLSLVVENDSHETSAESKPLAKQISESSQTESDKDGYFNSEVSPVNYSLVKDKIVTYVRSTESASKETQASVSSEVFTEDASPGKDGHDTSEETFVNESSFEGKHVVLVPSAKSESKENPGSVSLHDVYLKEENYSYDTSGKSVSVEDRNVAYDSDSESIEKVGHVSSDTGLSFEDSNLVFTKGDNVKSVASLESSSTEVEIKVVQEPLSEDESSKERNVSLGALLESNSSEEETKVTLRLESKSEEGSSDSSQYTSKSNTSEQDSPASSEVVVKEKTAEEDSPESLQVKTEDETSEQDRHGSSQSTADDPNAKNGSTETLQAVTKYATAAEYGFRPSSTSVSEEVSSNLPCERTTKETQHETRNKQTLQEEPTAIHDVTNAKKVSKYRHPAKGVLVVGSESRSGGLRFRERKKSSAVVHQTNKSYNLSFQFNK